MNQTSNNSKISSSFSLININEHTYINDNKEKIVDLFNRSLDIIYRAEVYPEFKFSYLSPSIENILGYTIEDHIITPNLPLNIVHPDHKEYVLSKINGTTDYSTPKPVKYRHKNGNYIWLEDFTIPIYNEENKLIALEGVSRDVSYRIALEGKLEKLSFYDGLTGLHNKTYLEKEISILDKEKNLSIGVIFCDLDNLKITNDTFGHECGDMLANILIELFNENAIVSRSGGDEFIVILTDTTLHDCNKMLSLLCNTLEKYNKFNKDLLLEVSIGFAFSEKSLGLVRDVINTADENMYSNKRRKKSKNI
ncbi:sensor domain-containing diguanylate cyclase [Oceanirhabdus seepicola]|uniref:Sensor domain-containing diguanylate cyclase n=1 Tax=Oceanirhabdus seepicola TaxID=2828781 RepID=A0A9J6NZI1_9CLOT|nr:sensor domain-containing diguanylate cyclase [Oceanirhabdus seepicola]MCM1989021.1 sensor domain-containing diguanylate cyclase [Oceanirhabdus seepicola]